jgi:hypothetical protein
VLREEERRHAVAHVLSDYITVGADEFVEPHGEVPDEVEVRGRRKPSGELSGVGEVREVDRRGPLGGFDQVGHALVHHSVPLREQRDERGRRRQIRGDERAEECAARVSSATTR